MVEIIEQAILHLDKSSLWDESDHKLGTAVSRKIRKNQDLTTKQRKRIAAKLPKYSKEFSNWKSLSRNLSKWKRVEVPDDLTKLPRLDFDGKEMILYVGLNQITDGELIPKGKRRTSSLIWRYTAGSEITVQLSDMASKEGWSVTDNAKRHIASKMEKVLEKHKAIKEVRKLKKLDEVHIDLPLKTAPYEHQKKAMAIGIKLNRAALLMEQGTGKTLSAIGIAAHRFIEGQVKRLLIVAPKSVLPEWAMQMKEHTELPYQAVALDMKTKGKEKIFNTWEDVEGAISILTINYESISGFEKEIVKWSPDMIILDESQKIKNPTTVQAKTIYRIADKCNVEYRLILTGTPVSESPLDFFGQYRFLDPSIYGYSFSDFKARYAEFDYWGKVKKTLNQNELASKAHSIAYRITKHDANLNLPKENYEILHVLLDNEEQKAYYEMEEDAILQLSHDLISAPLIVTQLMKLQQITGGFVKDEAGTVHHIGNSKMEILKRFLAPRIEAKEKTIIFCKFVPEVELIAQYLEEIGTLHETLTGSTVDRGGALDRFKSDPENLVFLAQIKAGGVGITLTAADVAIFFSTGYSLIDYEQAKARIHRIGQTRPVTYVHLLAKNTVDEVIYDALANKKTTADLFVDHLKFISHKSKEEHTMAKLEDRLEDLKTDLNEGIAEPEATTEEKPARKRRGKKEGDSSMTKAAKEEKGPKKEKVVKEKKEKVVVEKAEVVSLAQIADEMGTTPAELRKFLRKSDIAKPDGRWEWEPGHPDIEKVKALDLTPAPKKSKKADAEDEAAE